MIRNDRGVTLAELIVAITVFSIISLAAAALMSVCMKADAYATDRMGLDREARYLMEKMTSEVRESTFVITPNSTTTTGNTLSLSGFVNDDNDYYFGDSLFPRIDEDLPLVDFGADLAPGIRGMDDDGDGQVDEGILNFLDNDEDGSIGEDGKNPQTYTFSSAQKALDFAPPSGASVRLSSRVTAYTATYEPDDTTHYPRILITLTLASATGDTVTFSEYAYPRNEKQYYGKRVL